MIFHHQKVIQLANYVYALKPKEAYFHSKRMKKDETNANLSKRSHEHTPKEKKKNVFIFIQKGAKKTKTFEAKREENAFETKTRTHIFTYLQLNEKVKKAA